MKDKIWKIVAIVSTCLLVVVIATSAHMTFSKYSNYTSYGTTTLYNVCEKLNDVAYELEGINYQLELLTKKID